MLPWLALALLAQSPSTFVAAYGSFQPSSSPKPSGGWLVATQTKASGLWSISGTDVYLSGNKLTTALWTGIATPLQTNWGSRVFLLGGIGGAAASTPTGSTSGYSVTGGLMPERPELKNKWLDIFLPKLGGPAVIKSSTGESVLLIRICWGVLAK